MKRVFSFKSTTYKASETNAWKVRAKVNIVSTVLVDCWRESTLQFIRRTAVEAIARVEPRLLLEPIQEKT